MEAQQGWKEETNRKKNKERRLVLRNKHLKSIIQSICCKGRRGMSSESCGRHHEGSRGTCSNRVTVTLTSMSPTSNDLLHLESKQGTSFEKSLLVCKNASSIGDESSSSCRGSLRTTDLPESQVLGKIKDFLQVMGEANHKLQKDIQDKGLREYDIEVLKGEEEQYIEMDLALGVAELHTPEALAAAESAMVGQDQTLPISATSNDGDSSSEGNDYSDSSCETGDDDNDDGDESGEGNARHSAIKSQKSKRTRFTINRKGLKRPKIEVLQ